MSSSSPKLRLYQLMAGAKHGGAELFFERLAEQFQRAEIAHAVSIKPYEARMDRLSAAGITPHTCHFRPLMKPIDSHHLARQIRAFDPSVVMSWMNRATNFTPAGNWTHVARLGGYYNLKYYRHCDWLVGNTRSIADWLVQQGWPADRVHHQVNFVPAPQRPALQRSQFDTPEKEPLIVALGRLHHNKGFDTLLRALAHTTDGVLWLAGEGPERNRLEALTDELGLRERVRFLGWQTASECVIAAADLFVCPSRHEPFGNVIAEAFAAGKPVIATRSDGAVEYIEDGSDGVLVPLDDPSALAEEIDTLIANEQTAQTLGKAAYHSWNRLFNPKQVTSDWISFLSEVAG